MIMIKLGIAFIIRGTYAKYRSLTPKMNNIVGCEVRYEWLATEAGASKVHPSASTVKSLPKLNNPTFAFAPHPPNPLRSRFFIFLRNGWQHNIDKWDLSNRSVLSSPVCASPSCRILLNIHRSLQGMGLLQGFLYANLNHLLWPSIDILVQLLRLVPYGYMEC